MRKGSSGSPIAVTTRPTTAAATLIHRALAIARLKASWKLATMRGMYGSTTGRSCAGRLPRIRAPRSPTELTSLATPEDAKRELISAF